MFVHGFESIAFVWLANLQPEQHKDDRSYSVYSVLIIDLDHLESLFFYTFNLCDQGQYLHYGDHLEDHAHECLIPPLK